MALKTSVKNNDTLDELLKKYNLELVIEPKTQKETKKEKK